MKNKIYFPRNKIHCTGAGQHQYLESITHLPVRKVYKHTCDVIQYHGHKISKIWMTKKVATRLCIINDLQRKVHFYLMIYLKCCRNLYIIEFEHFGLSISEIYGK